MKHYKEEALELTLLVGKCLGKIVPRRNRVTEQELHLCSGFIGRSKGAPYGTTSA